MPCPVPGVLLDELAIIPGSVPNLIALPEGCRFAPRCAARIEHNNVLATAQHPELRDAAPGHRVRCWLYHHEDGTGRPDPDDLAGGTSMTTTAPEARRPRRRRRPRRPR